MAKKKINILIIDDDLTLANALKLVLDAEGYYAQIAGDSATALELIKQEFYDILLVDYNLPDIHGLELIKQAHEISSESVPILITGISSMDLAFDGMRLGVHDYLVKPLDYNELKKIIKEIIEERGKVERGKKELQKIAGVDSTEIEEREVTHDQPVKAEKTAMVKPPEGDRKAPVAEVKPPEDTEKVPFSEVKPLQEVKEFLKPSGEIKKQPFSIPGETTAPPAPETEKEKTLFDFILDRSSMIRKKIKNVGIFVVIFAVLFIAIDTSFLRFTELGENLHNKIWPPDIVLETIPSGALVSLKDERNIEILKKNSYTPIAIDKIQPGNYSLRMNMDVYNTIERKITVFAVEKKIKDIFITGEAKKIEQKGKTQKFILPFELTVRIESKPEGATVYVDGTKMGNKTPVDVDLTAGLHTVKLEKKGFAHLGNVEIGRTYGQCNLDLSRQSQDGIDKRYWNLEVREGGGVSLKGVFWKEIKIGSRPSGAQFFVDGELIGVTPANVRLTVGEHKLKIKKSGFVSQDKTFSVPDKDKVLADLSKTVKFIAYDADNPGKDLGAEVWVDRKKIKREITPFQHSFKQATYRISFVKSPDYNVWTKNIKIKNQNSIVARMQLKKIPVKIKVADEDTRLPVDSAVIFVNGKERGMTTENGILQLDIKIGDRLIEVRREDYFKKSIKERVSEKTKEIEIYLEFEGELLPDGEEDILPLAEQKTCILIIDTRPNFPGASIYFDGRFKGETIRRIPDVPFGKHKITIKHPYIGKVSSVIKVDKPGQKIIVNFNSRGEVKIK